MVVAAAVGIALFQFVFWYAGVLDESVNYVLDSEYREYGIEPTRTRSEDVGFRRRKVEYRKWRDAAERDGS